MAVAAVAAGVVAGVAVAAGVVVRGSVVVKVVAVVVAVAVGLVLAVAVVVGVAATQPFFLLQRSRPMHNSPSIVAHANVSRFKNK